MTHRKRDTQAPDKNKWQTQEEDELLQAPDKSKQQQDISGTHTQETSKQQKTSTQQKTSELGSSRRGFIKQAGLATAGVGLLGVPSWAKGLFELGGLSDTGYPRHNIPQKKNIDPSWIKTLYQRGKVTTYRKTSNELSFIGMPVGGLHAGTVYIGGDGRLWLWQIFNETIEWDHEGIEPKTVRWNDGTSERKIRSRDGAAYIEPTLANNRRVLEQGFALRVKIGGKTYIKELNEEHWDEVLFEPAYPLATVKYSSKDFPLSVKLRAYSPFIPLDAGNSSLPSTILKIEVKNESGEALDVSILGWMENGANKLSAKENTGKRINSAVVGAASSSIFSSFDPTNEELKTASDHGSMCFTMHQADGMVSATIEPWPLSDKHFVGARGDEGGKAHAGAKEDADKKEDSDTKGEAGVKGSVDAPAKLVGGIGTLLHIQAGKSATISYSISWHFNNPHPKLKKLVKDAEAGYSYGAKFKDAREVDLYLQKHFKQFTETTELWVNTWNDSTLPHWFLERTFVNMGTLATANTYRFADGRFWSWEGVGACPGTCTHVWQYAQAVARIFPELERDLRERVDLGIGFKPDSGAILFRGENETHPAIDGQAGTILRFYREHQMSPNDAFLQKNWPNIKKAVQFMFAQDKNGDGMTDTPMENTLDAVWEGEIAWIVGLCIAAARAAQAMAEEMNDAKFAARCKKYADNGSSNMEKKLFNGEYFIHRPDPVQGRKKLGSYNTCHIDQVYGQSWAFQVGLGRILSREKTLSALRALWKYNFTEDVGPYIKTHIGGRPYVLSGEGGMIMNTNPHNEAKPYGEDVTWQLGYFHECMTGFEHQVAAHLMAEGLIEESLVLTRMIHDRYHGAKRNPFNEIECSDHYARAMASYGTFLSACGYAYHGPKGYMKFAPKLNPERFKTAFTAASGWGSYEQEATNVGQKHSFYIAYGQLELKKLEFESCAQSRLKSASARMGETVFPLHFKQEGKALYVVFDQKLRLDTGKKLEIDFA